MNNIWHFRNNKKQTNNVQELQQQFLNVLVSISTKYGLKLNIVKTKYVIVNKTSSKSKKSLTVKRINLKQLPIINYHDCNRNYICDTSKEIKIRIE